MGRELFAVPSEMRLIFFSPPLPLHPAVPLFNLPLLLPPANCLLQVTCPQEQHILDHFVSPLPYNYKVFADNTLSDHYPVLATFAL